MKTYTVYFNEPVVMVTFDETRIDGKIVPVKITHVKRVFEFHSLKPAKALIKANLDKYKGSCITKTWANGDWENLGEINIKGSNKTFVANTRQRKSNY